MGTCTGLSHGRGGYTSTATDGGKRLKFCTIQDGSAQLGWDDGQEVVVCGGDRKCYQLDPAVYRQEKEKRGLSVSYAGGRWKRSAMDLFS